MSGPDATLVLVRHGHTEDDDRCHGARSDPPLSARGVRQARSAALRLKVLARELGGFTRLLTSPAERAIGTTAELAVALDLAPAVDERWRERDFGTWEGQRWDELWPTVHESALSSPEAYAAWTPPEGEEAWEVASRVGPALDDALDASVATDGATLVVAHAGSIRQALATALAVDLAVMMRVEVEHTRAVVLRRTGDATRLVRLGV